MEMGPLLAKYCGAQARSRVTPRQTDTVAGQLPRCAPDYISVLVKIS